MDKIHFRYQTNSLQLLEKDDLWQKILDFVSLFRRNIYGARMYKKTLQLHANLIYILLGKMYSYSLSKFCQSDVGGSCANKRQSKLRKFTAHPPGILVIDIIGPDMYTHTFQVEVARKRCKFMRESCELLVFNVLLYFLQSCALIKLVHVRVFTKARRPSWIGKTSNATSNYPLPIS